MKVQLPHQVVAVFFDGFWADKKQIGDFFVFVAFGDELEHLPFPLGKRIIPC